MEKINNIKHIVITSLASLILISPLVLSSINNVHASANSRIRTEHIIKPYKTDAKVRYIENKYQFKLNKMNQTEQKMNTENNYVYHFLQNKYKEINSQIQNYHKNNKIINHYLRHHVNHNNREQAKFLKKHNISEQEHLKNAKRQLKIIANMSRRHVLSPSLTKEISSLINSYNNKNFSGAKWQLRKIKSALRNSPSKYGKYYSLKAQEEKKYKQAMANLLQVAPSANNNLRLNTYKHYVKYNKNPKEARYFNKEIRYLQSKKYAMRIRRETKKGSLYRGFKKHLREVTLANPRSKKGQAILLKDNNPKYTFYVA